MMYDHYLQRIACCDYLTLHTILYTDYTKHEHTTYDADILHMTYYTLHAVYYVQLFIVIVVLYVLPHTMPYHAMPYHTMI